MGWPISRDTKGPTMKTAYNLLLALFYAPRSYEKGLQELDARLCTAYNQFTN